ncbi:acyltransferase family protein [Pseudomonas oryziphila]|uniref:acyltransferase family protein n=1 Tax=Pseudomonas oryziphila TaxID=2894079 RepID=UPI0016807B00|nr:acyltransferase [Pseudomonas oryziphila]
MNKHREILPLTGLRFAAALIVFLFHIQLQYSVFDTPFIRKIIEQGAVGMSIFFMLSGYLLMLNYCNSESNLKDYFINRLARIYPVYFVAGLVTLPWLKIGLGDTGLEMITGSAKAIFIFISNIFVIQAWFPQLFSYWNNGASWSISVEVFCYAILPLAIPALNKLSRRGIILLIVGLYFFSFMTGLSAKLYDGYGTPIFYAMPIFRLPEFLIGACTYLIVKNWPTIKRAWIFQLFAALGLASYLGIIGGWMPLYIGHNWLVIPVVALTIYTLSTDRGPLVWVLSRSPFVWLGKISYCFYSFQALTLMLLATYHTQITSSFPILENGKALTLAAFIFLTALSAAGYYLIEEPARRAIKNQWPAKSSLKIADAVN